MEKHAPTHPQLQPLLERLCEEHGIQPVPRLELSTRMVTALGTARWKDNLIRLSVWLAPEQADDTLRHELAHVAAGREGRDLPHGPRWQSWARRLGAAPKAAATHPPALAEERRAARRCWGLECPGCGIRIVRTHVLRGVYHRPCGSTRGRLLKAFRGPRHQILDWAASGL